MIWVISDTHFGHKNIVRGTSQWTDKSGCRDYDTLETHDTSIIDVINGNVGRKDVLWHLGDWSFGGEANIQRYRDMINCETIHIVLGNHDHHIQKNGHQKYGFASSQHYKELVVGATSLVLCHYPMESWSNMERGSLHLHGHTHGQLRVMKGRYDMGIEAHGLTSMDEIVHYQSATTQRHVTIEGGNKFG